MKKIYMNEKYYSNVYRFTKSDHWSRRQAELFIATQAALLSNNEEAAQTPVELSKQIRNLLKSNPDLAEAV